MPGLIELRRLVIFPLGLVFFLLVLSAATASAHHRDKWMGAAIEKCGASQMANGKLGNQAKSSLLVCALPIVRQQVSGKQVIVDEDLSSASALRSGDFLRCGFSSKACGHFSRYWPTKLGYMTSPSCDDIADFHQSLPQSRSARAILSSLLHHPRSQRLILRGRWEDIGATVRYHKPGRSFVGVAVGRRCDNDYPILLPPCQDTDLQPSSKNLRRIERATICLINGERVSRGLRPLREQSQLQKMSRDFSQQMVREHFFDHVDPQGGRIESRLHGNCYIWGGFFVVGIPDRLGASCRDLSSLWELFIQDYNVGEILAAGPGESGRPAIMVDAWMRSEGHRDIILTPEFNQIGAGIAPSTTHGDPGGVYVANLGLRRF